MNCNSCKFNKSGNCKLVYSNISDNNECLLPINTQELVIKNINHNSIVCFYITDMFGINSFKEELLLNRKDFVEFKKLHNILDESSIFEYKVKYEDYDSEDEICYETYNALGIVLVYELNKYELIEKVLDNCKFKIEQIQSFKKGIETVKKNILKGKANYKHILNLERQIEQKMIDIEVSLRNIKVYNNKFEFDGRIYRINDEYKIIEL
jgi:hypothetical protein